MTFQLMYDGIHDDVPAIPTTAPKVAGYVSGSNHGFWWTAADWARFPHASHVRIDTDGSVPLASDVADCESGDLSPAGAARWARIRQDHGYWSTIYCSESALPAVRSACSAAGVSKVTFWIANWSLTQAEAAAKLGGDIVAVQYSSPSVNPGQRFDLSVTRTDWWPVPTPPPATLDGILVTGAGPYSARGVHSRDGGKTWS